MSVKIIADTNAVLNKKSLEHLLGSRDKLQGILNEYDVDLIIPSTVLDELIFQKSSILQAAKQRLLNNPYYRRLSEDIRRTVESNDLDESALRADQSIPFTEINIQNDADAFAKIRRLAINHDAPFAKYNSDAKENTDKGFKDACIALTIDDYLAQLDSTEKILLVTGDARLAEYFEDNSRVGRVHNLDEARDQIQVVTNQLPANTMTFATTLTTIKAPSPERIAIQKLLTEFRNTPNFKTTHILIVELYNIAKDNLLTDDDYIDILKSTVQNDQITWLLGDEDVRGFILPIFTKYGDRLDVESYNIIAPGLELDSKTPEPGLIDYEEAEAAYEVWAELQADIARGR